MRSDLKKLFVSTAVVAVASVATAAQSQPVRLGVVQATIEDPRTHITGVRELRDGRVVVLDSAERTVHVADFRAGTMQQIGREGDGPAEYRNPFRLFAWRGDSSAVFDLSRTRALLIIAPDAKPVSTLSLAGASGNPGPTGPEKADQVGHVYSRIRVAPAESPDSMVVARWTVAEWRRDSVARVSVKYVSTVPGPPDGHGTAPFATRDQWTVSADGWVALITQSPYRVTWLPPRGPRIVGPELPDGRTPITNGHKVWWRADKSKPFTKYMLDSRGLVPITEKRTFVEPDAWPTHVPAFIGEDAMVAPNGSVWIPRTRIEGEPATVDVVNRAGRLERQIVLPQRARLVGFGRSNVYLAVRDSDDFERLARAPLP